MAFSFAVMEKLKVKLPIMLDDIFYASDFHNRRNIKHFVKAILTAYKSIFENGKDNSEQPDKIGSKLQLVIFTHDELVFKSITDEIKEFHKMTIANTLCSIRYYHIKKLRPTVTLR